MSDPVKILKDAFPSIEESIANTLSRYKGRYYDDEVLAQIDDEIQEVQKPEGWVIQSYSRKSSWSELGLGFWDTLKEVAYYYFCFGMVPDLRRTIIQSEVTVLSSFEHVGATCTVSTSKKDEE